ncbi:Protein of unknown function [Pyronema omphalodes CBS 100304]|uniref:Uncharacterized protein n=1 Tax=Pyronema omphalodes (strain CBS 100304) TaxID=1076935 RepID=U4LGY4_PYROM|nr:Protein of unknown function [Pyronema omphalodes CBS 100304]
MANGQRRNESLCQLTFLIALLAASLQKLA